MANCKIAKLSDRGVVRVSGGDARKFLQDVVTNDVTKARQGTAVHAALLMPQGKILFDFFLTGSDDQFLLECDREKIGELIKRLLFYKLRADVEFEDLSSAREVWAAWGDTGGLSDEFSEFDDPRLAGLGKRIIARSGANPGSTCATAREADYHAHRISLGVPESGKDYPLGFTFPHEADFDQLNGVDFKKGCYVGQEVVSRMQHRGTARTRIVPVRGATALTAGSPVVAGDSSLGTLGSVSDNSGLAMVRLDRAEKAIDEGKRLMAGDVEIDLVQPKWATFTVPVDGGQ